MTSHGGKLTAPACHPTQKINKAEELTCLSTNIFVNSGDYFQWCLCHKTFYHLIEAQVELTQWHIMSATTLRRTAINGMTLNKTTLSR
jgi:hypothetical protein